MPKSNGLNTLAEKEPVVATHVGIFDSDNIEQTYWRYQNETTTFVVSPEILQYQKQFIQTILEQKTTLACLVAPFGYGKTSTAINIWKASMDAGLLAIPPFSCNSIAEMGQAIATALIYRLESIGDAKSASQVREAFHKYLTSSATRLAEQDAKRYGIDLEVALQSIEDKIKSGHLQLEASATHLLGFLEQLVTIASAAGFKGLVIIVDEFQQFLGNINKGVITNFRTLIWGLQTRGELPLGFLITMDPDTERNLTDRGADILHRIRNQGLYLTFSSVYDREFPRELWSRYAEAFGFAKHSSQIVDHATLEAIGQICERPDLSNGPRTVINIFQRIAALQLTRNQAYTPIDLIDDFLTGDIKFDGDRGKIASLVNEICSYDYIRRSSARVQIIKLISAFPRGCPPEVADRYSIRETYDFLLDELRGEILIELPEGVALIDLQRVGKPQNKLNIILKKYWLQITEEEIISDKALQHFARYGVSPLFPEYSSHQSGWKPETNQFLLTPNGGYFRVYEGTFFEEYPERRVAVQICFEVNEAVIPDGYVDAQFIFLIQRQEQTNDSSFKSVGNIPTYIIPIPIHQPFSRQLPRDVRDIESFLSPVVLTPGVLVSLLNYIAEQVPQLEGVSEQEYQRILDTHAKLQEFLLTMLISDETFKNYGIKIYSRGIQAFRDALFNILRSRYPKYQTIQTSPVWRKNLDQYKQALENATSAQRRGIDPLIDTKSAIARLFEQRQYAGFESYIKQYNGLIEILDWRGDSGSITFHRHPHEDFLIEVISVDAGLTEDEVFATSRGQGYLFDETQNLIDFLLLRGYIERDEATDRLIMATTYTQDELINLARTLLNELHFMSEFLQPGDLHSQIRTLLENLERKSIDLSDAQVRLVHYQRQVQTARNEITLKLRAIVQNKIEQLYKYKARFDVPLPESAAGILLDSLINGAQRTLQSDVGTALSRLEKRIHAMRKTIEQSLDLDTNDFTVFKDYATQVKRELQNADEDEKFLKALLDQCETHHNWVQLIDRLKRLSDMTGAAAEITDTKVIEKNIKGIQVEIQQELASEGLKQYRSIYDNFVSPISEIQRELETLVHLAETRSRNGSSTYVPALSTAPKPASAPNGKSTLQIEHPNQDGLVNLREMLQYSNKDEVEFLHYLLQLSEAGEILIYWRKHI